MINKIKTPLEILKILRDIPIIESDDINYNKIKISGYIIPEHRAIWELHYGEIPKGYHIHHVNGNKKDNKIQNLECISRKEHGKKHLFPNRKRIKYKSGIKVINLTE